jgi:RNA-directed DNA polymerase
LAVAWKQWKRGRRRFEALCRLGVDPQLAAQTAGSAHGPWRISRSPALSYALPNAYFTTRGLVSLTDRRA